MNKVEQTNQDFTFIQTKDGMIVGTEEQCNAYFRAQNKRNVLNDHCTKATIVKKANPKAIAHEIETSSEGTRLLNYKNIRFAMDEKQYKHNKSMNQYFISSKDEEQKKIVKEEAHEYCRKLAKFCKAHGVDKTDEIERISITSVPKLYTAILMDEFHTYNDVKECIEMFKFNMLILELLGETKGEIKADKVTIQLLETYKMKQFGQFVSK
jgi:hypothetical protein